MKDIKDLEKLLLQILEKLNFQNKEVLDINEVAKLTSLSKNYIYKLNHEGKIPCYSYSENGKLFFKRSEIEDWQTQFKRFNKFDDNIALSIA